MKKLIIAIICLVVGFIAGIIYTTETMQVDIIEETDTGAIIRIIGLDQWFNHYVEK